MNLTGLAIQCVRASRFQFNRLQHVFVRDVSDSSGCDPTITPRKSRSRRLLNEKVMALSYELLNQRLYENRFIADITIAG